MIEALTFEQGLWTDSYKVVKAAAGKRITQITDALSRLRGKRVSRDLVEKQTKPFAKTLQLDFYGSFLRWLTAFWCGNRAGAEILMEDLNARFAALREDERLPITLDAAIGQLAEAFAGVAVLFVSRRFEELEIKILLLLQAGKNVLAAVRREKRPVGD